MSEALSETGSQQVTERDTLLDFFNINVRSDNGKKNISNRTRRSAGQNTDFSAEQLVFDFESALLRGNISGRIFGAIDYREAVGGTGGDGSGSQNSILADIRETDKEFAEGILGESQSIEIGRTGSQRDSFGTSYLSPVVNFRLTDEHFERKGGAKTRFRNNINAIKLIYELEEKQMSASKEQQAILVQYVGWGGLAQAFDEFNADWQKEYQELKELLKPQDYRKAKDSVLSSFYTSKTVIDGVYEGLRQLGFNSGTVLEPALGTGNFLGLMPIDFNTHVYGIEIDNISGKIAKHLYPKATVKIMGFEETEFPHDFFDSVITNVPFGSFKVFDNEYKDMNLYIHDYFIIKSLDRLRSGGVAAIITSKGTMDKANGFIRKCFATRAELLGAIRLPNTAFKDSANTVVTSDILFFKKRAERDYDSESAWINSEQDDSGIWLNKYFLDHPEMILGKMVKGKDLYGGENETYCEADGRDLKTALSEAVKRLPQNVYEQGNGKVKDMPRLLAEDFEIKNHCYGILDNRIYLRVGAELIPQSVSYANQPRLKAMIELRQLLRHLLDIQLADCSDTMLESTQDRLNRLYDSFTRQYGSLNSKANRTLFRDDADFTLLLALEDYDQTSGRAKKTDIFTQRTIRKYIRPERVDTALEALHISKNETGKVNLKIIEELTGKSYDEILAELSGHIYRNPLYIADGIYGGWETAVDYLSGNVKEKLYEAQKAAAHFPEFEANVHALLKVQPAPISAPEISVRLGMSWIKPEIYKQFLVEKFQLGWQEKERLTIEFNKFNGEWKVDAPSIKNLQVNRVYGTPRMSGFDVFEHGLNLRTPSVYDTIKDENKNDKRILNKAETIAVREKLRKIQEEFKSWIFEEPTRRNELVAIYNERFNNLVLANYDGSYLTFPEMNPLIELKQHQRDAVERIITSGNTLLHHVVGAGKTFEIAATAMKLRQMRLAHKPMIVVPNHLVMQWAHEFRTLYPNAKLLIATKKDFEKENRMRFASRIATGDWDAVVIAMSSFEKLPISKERQEKKIVEEIDNIEDALRSLKKEKGSRLSVKNLQKALKNKQATLEKLTSGKKDDLIKFEDLGVDYLFVDEAHKFKNKFIFTKMNNVAGISRAMSKRSTDLDMKIDYISELHGGQKGVVFATGTPISNSMVEMYTMQSYLQKDTLRAAGLTFFDDWAANFGDTQTALELAPSGQGYRSKTRFAKFVNLPELLKMYRSFADVKTADMLDLPVPKANKHNIVIKPTDEIIRLNEVISERAEKIQNKEVKPEEDNMLRITGDGKKLALDPRCFDRSACDDSKLKVNVCAENFYRIWNETKDKRSTQLVFCDLSTPKKAFEEYNPDTDFDVYNHVKTTLVKMGIPKHEIAFIHEADSDMAKQALFDNVRSGRIRILIGSTEKCGAGTNVQKKLKAIHHLDTPYRPSDMEQREGRGVRQGNDNPEIDIFTYVTEQTFDAYSYQILENKQRFISQINRGELTVREAADIDEATLSYAEIKAITSANPLIKRKFEVESELGSLRVLQSQYKTNLYNLQDNLLQYLPKEIEATEKKIANYEKDIVLRDSNSTSEFFMTVNGQPYSERKDAAELLHKFISNVNAGKKIASINGFDIIPEYAEPFGGTYVLIKGNGSYRVQTSASELGTLTRLENFFKSMEDNLNSTKMALSTKQAEIISAKIEVEKPFEHEQRILDLFSELAEIEAKLNLDKTEIAPVIDDEQFQDENFTEETEIEEPDEEYFVGSEECPIITNETDSRKSDFYM